MKKDYLFKFTLLLIPVSAFILMSNSSGRDDGRSGSPGDSNVTCAACHSGGNFSASLDITTDIPATGYDTNTSYNITVTNTSSGASAYGFQLVAERTSDDLKVGSFTAGTNSRVSGDRITHSNANSNTWSFTWTSPSTDLGSVRFYAASVAANGNGNTSGDQTVIGSTANVNALGISELQRLDFTMYPNPSSDKINIQLATGNNYAAVEFYNFIGQLVYSKKMTTANREIDISHLNSGIYLLKVKTNDKLGVQQFIKQ